MVAGPAASASIGKFHMVLAGPAATVLVNCAERWSFLSFDSSRWSDLLKIPVKLV
jgi:hypothetical protein